MRYNTGNMDLKKYCSFIRIGFNTSIVNADIVVELVQTTYKTGAFQVFKDSKLNQTTSCTKVQDTTS